MQSPMGSLAVAEYTFSERASLLMLIGRFIRYHVDPLICVHCHIDPLNTMLTPNCCYRATPLLLDQQCMLECCVQSPMGSLAMAEYTFSERASTRESVTLRVFADGIMAQQTSPRNYMTVIYQVYTWYMTFWIYLSYTCHMTGI